MCLPVPCAAICLSLSLSHAQYMWLWLTQQYVCLSLTHTHTHQAHGLLPQSLRENPVRLMCKCVCVREKDIWCELVCVCVSSVTEGEPRVIDVCVCV